VFLKLFSVEGPINNLFIPLGTPAYENEKKIVKRLLLAHGDYSDISNCRTKILAIFPGIFKMFAVFQNSYVFIPIFLSEPLTMFCGNPRFRGALCEKHRCR
jgi:hypothetical protein